jgi:hypothetical protein
MAQTPQTAQTTILGNEKGEVFIKNTSPFFFLLADGTIFGEAQNSIANLPLSLIINYQLSIINCRYR